MSAGPTSIALSGIAAAHTRVHAASHNIANLQTEDFHPVKVSQSSLATGGTVAEVEHSPEPEPVATAEELIGARLAVIQAKASARVIQTDLDLLGSLLNLHA